MSELIPFPGKDYSTGNADIDVEATEITLEDGAPPPARVTQRLPAETNSEAGLGDILLAPLTMLPAETQAHLRTAGREAALTLTSLAATLLKGTAIALNVAGEALKDYTERNSKVIDLHTARQARQRVEIEVE